MKLSDFSVLDEQATDELHEFVQRVNQTQTDYPRHKTVHQLFMEQAARTPEAVAAICAGQTLSYGELDRLSTQLAHFLLQSGLVKPETFVGVMLERSLEVVVSVLGILKAGAAYVPVHGGLPIERIKYLLNDAQVPILISQKRYIRTLNQLQWECPVLTTILCIDSQDVYSEIETSGGLMDLDVWEYVAQETVDDISGGGWVDSYTGQLLSREVMDAYGDNILHKLKPHLNRESRVLEIGCASGISMFRLAPLVGHFTGTDLSPGIIEWSQNEATQRGLQNIQLACLAAHEIDKVAGGDFDMVILNSVIECFSGHNYLRDVLRKAINLLKDDGLLFLGNLWDQDSKDAFVRSLVAFKQAHLGQGYRTKIDRSDELFVSRSFLEDLRHDFPEISAIEYSTMLGEARSELSEFGFDAIVHIDKRRQQTMTTRQQRYKYQFDRRILAQYPVTALPECTRPDGLAYLIYTSGTSGQPKGVMVEHRSIVRLVVNTNYVALRAADRILQTGALSFDASTFEIWGALLHGGTVCFPEGYAFLGAYDLGQLIRQEKITTIFLTTGFFNQLVDVDLSIFAGLKTLFTGGEQVSARHINALRKAYPELLLNHVYGPTENTTFTTCYRIDHTFDGNIPIGTPLANTTVYVLDEQLQPTPIGTPGELCTGGDGLARGYLNDPALTARKFVTLSFAPYERVYRTGDLVRQMADGNIEFLGRIDNQVKIRGYRIEPDEIEQTLLQCAGVKEAVVSVRQVSAESKELIGYLTGEESLMIEEARTFLQKRLPEYMVPTYLLKLEKLPLNPNGKVDRRKLPDPTLLLQAQNQNYIPPSTPTEEVLAEIWAEVLGRTQIGVTDDFFEAGGHSLKVAKVVNLIQQRLGITIPLVTVFNAPTIQQLAVQLLKMAQFGHELADEVMALLNPGATGPKVFAFPPGTGDLIGYLQLAALLKPFAFYGFNFIEDADRIEQYVSAILKTDPVGPYLLFGYSGGGNLAFHVAKALEAQGKCVSDLVMVDSSRLLAPVAQDPAQVEAIINDFLDHESVRPLLSNPVLGEKLARRIRASYGFISTLVDRHQIQANIHHLVADELHEEYRDTEGRVLASSLAWAEATSGAYVTYQGVGEHIAMLLPPHLAHNAEKLRAVLLYLKYIDCEGERNENF